ncbi:MAG: hypothetical protein Q8R39_00735, partial [bacterium]|nr:hypothetical protein [bacterium]
MIFSFYSLALPESVRAAWVGPSEPPPGNNAPSPINIGANNQIKVGELQTAARFRLFRGGVGAGAFSANGAGTVFGLLRETLPIGTFGLVVENATGNVGIGTTVPGTNLDVTGGIWTSAAGSGRNVFYDLSGERVAAGSSIYSYGSICTGNISGA